MSGASPLRSLDPGALACSEQCLGTVTAETQVVQLTLLKTKHLSLMILNSSRSSATSTTHVHGCTRYVILYCIFIMLPHQWMEALLSMKNLHWYRRIKGNKIVHTLHPNQYANLSEFKVFS